MVERRTAATGDAYVPNDINLNGTTSQLVVLTREGLKAKSQSRTALEEIETDLGKELGQKGVSELNKALSRLVDAALQRPDRKSVV